LNGFERGSGSGVRALCDHRVVAVYEADNSRQQRNLRARRPVRIP
jgi:hypothetical protein